MAKVSASTLVRRASKTKDKAAAKRLRAMAAKVRREARAKKARGNVAGKADRADGALAVQSIARVRVRSMADEIAEQQNDGPMVMHHDAAGGWNEIGQSGRYISDEQIDRLRGAAKVKPKKMESGHIVDGFAIGLRASLLEAQISGKSEAEKEALRRIKANLEAQSINVVCAFVAEMNGIAALNRGPLPPSVMVSGYTLARVLDALKQAGYTENGKEGMKRHG